MKLSRGQAVVLSILSGALVGVAQGVFGFSNRVGTLAAVGAGVVWALLWLRGRGGR